MKAKPTTALLLALSIAIIVFAHSAPAATTAPAKTQRTPGLELAQTLSLVTGVAISPLLGVGAVGAYEYWHAPKERRAHLPWFAQPWFWVPALLLVAFVGVKDILGAAAPTALKKPFDVAETVENKVSGLVAAGAFLPLVISVFPEAAGNESHLMEMSPLAAAGFAAIDAGAIANALLVPFALAIFIVVWLASHAINILILLSPFTTLDTMLKAFRLGLLSLVSASAWANPWFGALVAIVVILVSYLIAGWSFRMTVLGTVFVWDLLTFRKSRFQPGGESNKMFTARPMEGAPTRTYGRLIHQPGGMVFEYRPWMILPKKRFTLHQAQYIVGRGIFYPELGRLEGERVRTVFLMSPRYCGHEDAVARVYGISDIRDVGLRRGLVAAWTWLKNLFKGNSADIALSPAPDAVRS